MCSPCLGMQSPLSSPSSGPGKSTVQPDPHLHLPSRAASRFLNLSSTMALYHLLPPWTVFSELFLGSSAPGLVPRLWSQGSPGDLGICFPLWLSWMEGHPPNPGCRLRPPLSLCSTCLQLLEWHLDWRNPDWGCCPVRVRQKPSSDTF